MNSKRLFAELKTKAHEFSIYDLMNVRIYLEKEMKYLPKDYQEGYMKDTIEYFLDTLKEIKGKKEEEIENFEIEEEKLKNLLERIDRFSKGIPEEKSFMKLSKIVVPYLVFIAKKPLHALTTRFPGGLTITKKNGEHYCPVKNRQTNEYSLCEFCICKDPKEI